MPLVNLADRDWLQVQTCFCCVSPAGKALFYANRNSPLGVPLDITHTLQQLRVREKLKTVLKFSHSDDYSMKLSVFASCTKLDWNRGSTWLLPASCAAWHLSNNKYSHKNALKNLKPFYLARSWPYPKKWFSSETTRSTFIPRIDSAPMHVDDRIDRACTSLFCIWCMNVVVLIHVQHLKFLADLWTKPEMLVE